MKQFTILLAGLALAINTQAQTTTTTTNKGTSYVSLGPVVGVGHSRLTNISNQFWKPSPYAGIGLVYARHEHWGFGGDLVVSHEGYKTEQTIGNVDYTYSVNPVYLRLTPKAYYFFGQYGDNVRPKVYLGPSVGFKMDEVMFWEGEKVSANGEYTVAGTTHTNSEVFSDIDAGITGGVGVNIKLAKYTWLNLDGSFYQGLLDVSDNHPTNHMNQNMRLNVGLMFGL